MYAKIVEKTAVVAPGVRDHSFIELWRVEAGRVGFLAHFETVPAARRMAERVGPGSYFFTSSGGRQYLRLEIPG